MINSMLMDPAEKVISGNRKEEEQTFENNLNLSLYF